MPCSAPKNAFPKVGIASDRIPIRVETHEQAPEDLAGTESQEVEDRVHQHPGAVPQLAERC